MKKIYFVFILMICFITNSKAQNTQPNWELQTPQSGNNSYVARDYILLKPGFSYTSHSGREFSCLYKSLPFIPSDRQYLCQARWNDSGRCHPGGCCWENTRRIKCRCQWECSIYNSYILSSGS